MALPRLPASVVAEYVGGNTTVISQRLVDLATTNPGQVRAATEEGARAIALHYCEHADPPEILGCYHTKAEARQAAEAHPGLCGLQLSGLIASVRIQHVLDRGLQPTATKLRNQVSECIVNVIRVVVRTASTVGAAFGTLTV